MSGLTAEKRYNLAIPQTLYNELEALANARGVTVVAIIREFMKLGLAATAPDVQLIARYPDGTERELELII